jgi:predicted DNA-binding transcriptional regulator
LDEGDEISHSEIAGNTLRTYWYVLMKNQECGVREIQRALNFSSSSTAHYHLEKLLDKGLLTKDTYGNYRLSRKRKIGQIDSFIILNRVVFPKQLLYAVATSVMWVFFMAFFWHSLNLAVLVALLPGILACGIFWFETARLWSRLPMFRQAVR